MNDITDNPAIIYLDSMDLTSEIAVAFVNAHIDTLAADNVLREFVENPAEFVNFTELANAAYIESETAATYEIDLSWVTLGEWAEDKAGAQR